MYHGDVADFQLSLMEKTDLQDYTTAKRTLCTGGTNGTGVLPWRSKTGGRGVEFGVSFLP
jgi:hypothetical protein